MKSLQPLYKNILGLVLGTILLLLIPFTAMQFSGEVNWTLSDFVIAGLLLFGTGLAYVFIREKKGHYLYRMAAGIALLTTLMLIWSNLAVGLMGSENNPANLMYFGVPVIGLLGAFLCRLKAEGMSLTLTAMASAHVLIIIIAFVYGMQETMGSSVVEILGVNTLFILLFSLSAMLFRRASNDREINPQASAD